jgi:N-acyl-D-amino-acid deacylase
MLGVLRISIFSIFEYDPDITDTFYDLVIQNGRVMDPLTRTDVNANIGIKNGRIADIGPVTQPLAGSRVINATGLLVAPGFIDMHAHEGNIDVAMEAFVKDGRTTMISGQCGEAPYPLADFFGKLDNGCLINYASHFGHNTLRELVGIDRFSPATKAEIATMEKLAHQEMQSGALGISYGLAYAPGSSFEEQLALAKIVAEYGGMGSAHGRAGALVGVESIRELIELAKEAKIPFVLSHIGSTLGQEGNLMDEGLDLIARAQSSGIPFLADIYAYTSRATGISAAMLGPGVFHNFNLTPKDFEVAKDVIIDGEIVLEVGDRFESEEQFYWVRMNWNGPVIIHGLNPEKVKLAMQNPHVVCCSDGEAEWDLVSKTFSGHPRTSGNFARFLGYWVREQNSMDIMDALFKTSTQSALHLGLTHKGRIIVGADADITIFDPATIIDKADFGAKFLEPSEGISYVIVNGVLTVEHKKLLPGAMAGKTIRRTWKIPGYLNL